MLRRILSFDVKENDEHALGFASSGEETGD
jgi:hypothetical protein